MTSVQNHRQLLSGSSKWLLLLVFALSLQSCSVFEDIFGSKRTPSPAPPPRETKKPDDTTPEINKKPGVTEEDTIKRKDPPVLRDEVNIAVMLPFGIDKLDQGSDYSTASRNSFELYKGIRLALEEIYIDGFDLNVHVLDNDGSETETRKLLNDDSFEAMDLVFGPLYIKNLKQVADYAKSSKTPFISPLSSSDDIAYDNNYIFSAVANKYTRYGALLDWVNSTFDNPNIGIIYQPIPSETLAKDDIIRVAQSKKVIITEQISDGRDMFSAAVNLLEKDRKNIVIIPSKNDAEGQTYINGLMSYLQFEADKYDIAVVGLEEWNTMRNISPAKYSSIDTYYIDKYHVDLSNADTAGKISYLKNRNENQPLHAYAIQGYDIMMYLGELIAQYGTGFKRHLGKKPFYGLQSVYDFGKLKIGNDFRFNDNKHINIVAYKGGQWVRVN